MNLTLILFHQNANDPANIVFTITIRRFFPTSNDMLRRIIRKTSEWFNENEYLIKLYCHVERTPSLLDIILTDWIHTVIFMKFTNSILKIDICNCDRISFSFFFLNKTENDTVEFFFKIHSTPLGYSSSGPYQNQGIRKDR